MSILPIQSSTNSPSIRPIPIPPPIHLGDLFLQATQESNDSIHILSPTKITSCSPSPSSELDRLSSPVSSNYEYSPSASPTELEPKKMRRMNPPSGLAGTPLHPDSVNIFTAIFNSQKKNLEAKKLKLEKIKEQLKEESTPETERLVKEQNELCKSIWKDSKYMDLPWDEDPAFLDIPSSEPQVAPPAPLVILPEAQFLFLGQSNYAPPAIVWESDFPVIPAFQRTKK